MIEKYASINSQPMTTTNNDYYHRLVLSLTSLRIQYEHQKRSVWSSSSSSSSSTASLVTKINDNNAINNDNYNNDFENNDNYWFQVLELCEQSNPSHFQLEFPSTMFKNFDYIDSGTYSHVIKAIDVEHGNQPIVFKIIKVVQKITLQQLNQLSFNGFEQYSDVYQEIMITKTLSNLHQIQYDLDGYEYRTHCFPRIYRIKIVHGEIPNYFLVKKYNDSPANPDRIKPIERFEELHGVPREHLIIVMKYYGESLWHLFKKFQPYNSNEIIIDNQQTLIGLNPSQLLSICYQVTLSLCVAECLYQFEHRDLHVCNVLIKRTKKQTIEFIIRSIRYNVKSFGVKVCLIDATFSRICLNAGTRNERVYFTDLTNRLKATAQQSQPIKDGQEEAYKLMYDRVIDKWSDWYPETNIYWLKYFYNECYNSKAFRTPFVMMNSDDNGINDDNDQPYYQQIDQQQLHQYQSMKKQLKNLMSQIMKFKTLKSFIDTIFQQQPQLQQSSTAAATTAAHTTTINMN